MKDNLWRRRGVSPVIAVLLLLMMVTFVFSIFWVWGAAWVDIQAKTMASDIKVDSAKLVYIGEEEEGEEEFEIEDCCPPVGKGKKHGSSESCCPPVGNRGFSPPPVFKDCCPPVGYKMTPAAGNEPKPEFEAEEETGVEIERVAYLTVYIRNIGAAPIMVDVIYLLTTKGNLLASEDVEVRLDPSEVKGVFLVFEEITLETGKYYIVRASTATGVSDELPVMAEGVGGEVEIECECEDQRTRCWEAETRKYCPGYEQPCEAGGGEECPCEKEYYDPRVSGEKEIVHCGRKK